MYEPIHLSHALNNAAYICKKLIITYRKYRCRLYTGNYGSLNLRWFKVKIKHLQEFRPFSGQVKCILQAVMDLFYDSRHRVLGLALPSRVEETTLIFRAGRRPSLYLMCLKEALQKACCSKFSSPALFLDGDNAPSCSYKRQLLSFNLDFV